MTTPDQYLYSLTEEQIYRLLHLAMNDGDDSSEEDMLNLEDAFDEVITEINEELRAVQMEELEPEETYFVSIPDPVRLKLERIRIEKEGGWLLTDPLGIFPLSFSVETHQKAVKLRQAIILEGDLNISWERIKELATENNIYIKGT